MPEEGGDQLVRHDGDPQGSPNGVAAADWMNFAYDPVNTAKITAFVQFVSPVIGVGGELVKLGRDAADARREPAAVPRPMRTVARLYVFADLPDELDASDHRPLPRDHGRLSDGRRRPPTTARCAVGTPDPVRTCSLPGLLFLFVFFIVPLITLLKISLSTKPDRLLPELRVHVGVEQLLAPPSTDFGAQLVRAFAYAGVATVLCILIAYPIAYFIAFKAGQYRNILLGLVMVPFFTSFLLRTIAWQSLLNDNGPVLGLHRRAQHRRRPRPHRHPRRRSAAATPRPR